MALATRCPACSTVFRISTAQAAAKGGMVRCGQCRNVFNSLDALVRVEDLEIIDETIVEAPPSSLATVPAQPPAPAQPTSPPDDEPIDAAASASPLPVEAVETVHARFMPEASEAATDESRPASDDAVTREWWVPEHHEAYEWKPPGGESSATVAPLLASSASQAIDLRDDAGRMLPGNRGGSLASGPLVAMDPTFLQDERRARPLGRAARVAFGLLSLVAIVGLVAQAAFLWRDELAARWPPARPWLVAACQPLRCRVDPPVHLDAITIESASIQTSGSGPGTYLLTALLRNRGAIDVRYPYLELVLTDVQDRPILRRALRPEDYLSAPRDADRSPEAAFAGESELPIRLMFDLTDLRFAGYRLDKFHP